MSELPFIPADVLISGADDFLAKYLYRSFISYQQTLGLGSEARVWMLGIGEQAGIKVDLDAGSFVMPCPVQAVVHCDATDYDAPGFDSGMALNRAGNLTSALKTTPPNVLVYVSSVAVYGAMSGEDIDESTSCCPVTPYGRAKLEVEKYLTGWCDSHGVNMLVVRPAMVVGTGMGGPLRLLVNRIYRGTYRHVTGNEARVSVVHASNLADIVAHSIFGCGVYNVTDGENPTRHDLAEALAWRLDHKRIYSLPLSKARILARIGDYVPVTGFTSETLRHELSTLTFDGHAIIELSGVESMSVTGYLRNHTYDESSL